jgi:hypothetical protein
MSVISVSIVESLEQIISGIPVSVSLFTNISATIFYTLDGSVPTLFSAIYTSPISIPTNSPTIILSIFATNGVDSSPVVIETYQTNLLGQDARFPHSGTNAHTNSTQSTIDPAPFGSPPIQPNQQYLGPAEAGLTVYDPAKPAGPPTGYDSDGNPTGFTNNQEKALPTKRFPIIFSDSGEQGQEGYGIGTLPLSTVIPPTAPPEQTNINSMTFDPRAFVIIQDLTQPVDPGLPPHINRMNFTLEKVEITREGNQYFNVGPDAPPVSGNFVRREFDATKNVMTYYYIDTTQNRWIISKVPYTPAADQYNYAGSIKSGWGANRPGSQFVYQWIPFKGNYLY